MLTPAEVPKEDNSVVPKGVKESGIVVCLQELMVSLGSSVPGPTETDGLARHASEVLGAVICWVDGNIVVLCKLSELTWTQNPPKRRRRSKAISGATGGSRSWDLNVGKLQKNTGWGGKLGQPHSFCPLPCQLPSPSCGLTFFFFFPFLLSLLSVTTGEQMAPVTPHPGLGSSDSRAARSPWPHSLFQPVALGPLFPSPYSFFQTV